MWWALSYPLQENLLISFEAMKKIFFPFYNKYPKLNVLWWHRLSVVIFFVFIVVTPIFLFLFLVHDDIQSWEKCIDGWDYWRTHGDYSIVGPLIEEDCGANIVIHRRLNSFFAIISTIISSYFLQIVYYKIFLYIILGKRLDEFKQSLPNS